MPSTTIQEWENEHALSAYPFMQDAPYNNIIVDASFQQFDNFVPTLNFIQVSSSFLTINLTYDKGVANFVLQQADYISGINYIRLMIGTRYIGRITFQDGVNTLWNNYVGQQLIFNLPFVSTTIRSISSVSGVFTIAGLHGNVIFTNASSDTNIFFNSTVNPDLNRNFITFNAVGNHILPDSVDFQALKLLNLMSPVNNNVFIASSDVIQINGDGLGSLNISLIGSQFGVDRSKIADTTGF